MKKLFASIAVAAFAILGFATSAFAAQVRVEWSGVTGNQGYVIESKNETCSGTAPFTQLATVATNVVVFIGGDFAPNSNICVRVAALVGGVPQTFSAGTNFTVPGPLPAPGTVLVTAAP